MRFTNLELLERWCRAGGTGSGTRRRADPGGAGPVNRRAGRPTAEAKVPRNRPRSCCDRRLAVHAATSGADPLQPPQVAPRFRRPAHPGQPRLISFAGTAAVLVRHRRRNRSARHRRTQLSSPPPPARRSSRRCSPSRASPRGSGAEGPPPARGADERREADLPGPEGRTSRAFVHRKRTSREVKVPISTISFGTLLGRIDLSGRSTLYRDDVPAADRADLRRQFFTAASQEELQQVYATLGEEIVTRSARWTSATPGCRPAPCSPCSASAPP